MSLWATKSITALRAEADETGEHSLQRALGPLNLVTLGIGAIIGAGIFVLTGAGGRATCRAGPDDLVCHRRHRLRLRRPLLRRDRASMVPVAGSAYTYAYATLGELFAWIIGWDLVLEYAVGAATVAVGWSGYFVSLLDSSASHPAAHLTSAPTRGARGRRVGTRDRLRCRHGLNMTGAFVNLPAVAHRRR